MPTTSMSFAKFSTAARKTMRPMRPKPLMPDIIIYNEASEAGIIAINMKDIFAQDLAIYLNKYHICVRAGNHCAKMVKHIINIKNTVRISLYFYNTKEDIDSLVKALKNPNMKEEII